jgi:hypothetical protein
LSVQNQLNKTEAFKERILDALREIRSSSTTFDHAYETYIQQYGDEVVTVSDPINLVGAKDPLNLIFGRITGIQYSDATKTIRGSLGSMRLKQGAVYIIGRRQPQDSILVIWGPNGVEVDLEKYNPEAGVIPSRVHGAILFQDDENILFTDLCSSSGTIIVGETKRRGSFVCVYDPGSVEFPAIKLDWISTNRKS